MKKIEQQEKSWNIICWIEQTKQLKTWLTVALEKQHEIVNQIMESIMRH